MSRTLTSRGSSSDPNNGHVMIPTAIFPRRHRDSMRAGQMTQGLNALAEGSQFVSRCGRSFFVAVILVGLLSPVTGLDESVRVAVRIPLATLDDPDVGSDGPIDRLPRPDTDYVLPSRCVSSAGPVLPGRVLRSTGPRVARPIGLGFRIPRAPPVG